MTELNILGISGSLRKESWNTKLLHTAAGLAPEGMRIELYQRMDEIPLYNGDEDTEIPPEPVADLRRRIGEADGLLIATPEYNYSIPGVLKNALDWASRPNAGSAAAASLSGKPIAITGAAPSNFGSVRAQLALRQMFVWTDSRVVVKPEVIVFRSHERFDDGGSLTDRDTEGLLRDLLGSLADTAGRPIAVAA